MKTAEQPIETHKANIYSSCAIAPEFIHFFIWNYFDQVDCVLEIRVNLPSIMTTLGPEHCFRCLGS